MKRVLLTSVMIYLCVVLLPITAYAQASISGVVKDSSGAVLPGVTVEASSPALIEKSRSTVTDSSGQYQIIQLVPGSYTVTFTLQGFKAFKRDGVELSGSFVASVNAALNVGDVAETITVTGETPLVDVRSSNVQQVVSKEVVDAIPTGRLGINLAALQPGMILGAGGGVGQSNTNSLTSQDVGGTAGDTFTDLAIHGGKPAEQLQTIGGVAQVYYPGEPGGQAGRTAAVDGRRCRRHDDPLRRVAQQLAQLHRDAGKDGQHRRRRRVDGRRRRADQLRAARWRQHLQGTAVLLRCERCHAGNQLFERHPRRHWRLHAARQPVLPWAGGAAGRAQTGLRLQPRLRRADSPQSPLVLRDRTVDEGRELRAQRVPEQELRRRPDQPDAAQYQHDAVFTGHVETTRHDARWRRL